MSHDVFLSVGKPQTQAQMDFVSTLRATLTARGLTPRTVGQTDYSAVTPLRRVSELMSVCQGTVVLAYERFRMPERFELRGVATDARTGQPATVEECVKDARVPTVWNQVEATMAYMQGHPLLVIVERGLQTEALLSSRYEWQVLTVDLDKSATTTEEFQGTIADWCRRVDDHALEAQRQREREATASASELDVTQMSVRTLLSTLTLSQVWAVIAALIVVLTFVGAVAYQAGQAS